VAEVGAQEILIRLAFNFFFIKKLIRQVAIDLSVHVERGTAA
jgi:hypothetical protein